MGGNTMAGFCIDDFLHECREELYPLAVYDIGNLFFFDSGQPLENCTTLRDHYGALAPSLCGSLCFPVGCLLGSDRVNYSNGNRNSSELIAILVLRSPEPLDRQRYGVSGRTMAAHTTRSTSDDSVYAPEQNREIRQRTIELIEHQRLPFGCRLLAYL